MTNTWADRRGMFQAGKAVHEPAPANRRVSQDGVGAAIRRASINSVNSVEKTPSGTTPSPVSSQRRRVSDERAAIQRSYYLRLVQSSAASNGMFGNLTSHKRGSEDYGERRASHHEQREAGGLVSGWWNSTMRGVQKPQGIPTTTAQQIAQQKAEDRRRGVME